MMLPTETLNSMTQEAADRYKALKDAYDTKAQLCKEFAQVCEWYIEDVYSSWHRFAEEDEPEPAHLTFARDTLAVWKANQ